MEKLILSLMIFFSCNGQANTIYPYPDESKGFHWYNDPIKIEEIEDEKPSNPVDITPQNAEKVIRALQQELDQRKAFAILKPTTQNIADYRQVQDVMTELSSKFASQWKRSLLEFPDLDYNLKYSHYNNMASVTLQNDKQHQLIAITELTKKYGLFFFYRGENEIDKQFASVVKQFSVTYNVPIIAISVDREISPLFPLTKSNKGIVEKLNIKYFPSIMLVEPKTETIKPLSYGFISMTDLEKRFLDVATDFKPNY